MRFQFVFNSINCYEEFGIYHVQNNILPTWAYRLVLDLVFFALAFIRSFGNYILKIGLKCQVTLDLV